jgi:hypothetical protein
MAREREFIEAVDQRDQYYSLDRFGPRGQNTPRMIAMVLDTALKQSMQRRRL